MVEKESTPAENPVPTFLLFAVGLKNPEPLHLPF